MLSIQHSPSVTLDELTAAVTEHVIRPVLDLVDLDSSHHPIYAKTATFGHVGRELPGFTWEQLDRVEALRAAVGLYAGDRV